MQCTIALPTEIYSHVLIFEQRRPLMDPRQHRSKGVFSSENFWLLATVALSFLFGKNCPIMDYLGLKDSSHDFSANCVISFFFVYI